MTNRGKHYVLTRSRKTITKDEFIPRFDYSRFDYSKVNYGKPIFRIVQDGQEINLFEECKKIFNVYKNIYEDQRELSGW